MHEPGARTVGRWARKGRRLGRSLSSALGPRYGFRNRSFTTSRTGIWRARSYKSSKPAASGSGRLQSRVVTRRHGHSRNPSRGHGPFRGLTPGSDCHGALGPWSARARLDEPQRGTRSSSCPLLPRHGSRWVPSRLSIDRSRLAGRVPELVHDVEHRIDKTPVVEGGRNGSQTTSNRLRGIRVRGRL